MNADLTIKTKNVKLVYSDEGGSLRKTATGDIVTVGRLSLTIGHQDYIDSKTKSPGRRHVVRFQQDAVNITTGQPLVAYAQLTVGRPSDPTITDSDMLAMIDSIRQMIATTSADAAALNLASNIFVTEEQ